MAAPIENQVQTKKSKKKLNKKIARSQHTIFKHDGIETCNIITNILCVNNGGLDVGVSCDEISGKFGCYGDILDIVMLPRKPYCFVCFKHIKDAEAAIENLNGTDLPPSEQRSNTVTLYISYVRKVPDSLSPSTEVPPGLIILPDFVTDEYATEIMNSIDWEESNSPAEQRELKHRHVKHYGYEFKYGINDVDVNDPLPNGIPEICDQLLREVKVRELLDYTPDQLTVNKYEPGQGIPPHVDTPAAFEDGIMSLSLGSQTVMDFRHPDGRHLTVLLPPKSLMIMTGESRYVWSHGITPRKSDIIRTDSGSLNVVRRGVRVSLTFRKIIHPEERVRRVIPTFSKIQSSDTSLPQEISDVEKLERDHVHKVYEEIADHFSGTRHTPWPRIVEFLKTHPPGSLMADIGCGNGKYLGVNSTIYSVGSDRSKNLVGICRDRQFEAYIGDVLTVPLRTGSMDISLCIAVIHHLSTQKRRLHAIQELVRILRPGGKSLIYVWAMEQELNKVKSKYLKEKKFERGMPNSDSVVDEGPKTNGGTCESGDTCDNTTHESDITSASMDETCASGTHEDCKVEESEVSNNSCACADTSDEKCCKSGIKLAVHKNRTEFKQQDLLVPWELKGGKSGEKTETSKNVFHRFYHVFQKGELEALCAKVSDCKVIESYYDQGNWAVILEKV